jgi:hypothetical protein
VQCGTRQQSKKTQAHLTGAVVPFSDERRNHQNKHPHFFGLRAHPMMVFHRSLFQNKGKMHA